MTVTSFDSTMRGFCRRRPFRAFLIEFFSGSQLRIPHPEAVRTEGDAYFMRRPDGTYVVFEAQAVACVLDVAIES